MATILVSGVSTLETTLRVGGFPLAYTPVNFAPFGIRTTVSGVGFNIAKALTTLGHEVRLCSLIGRDVAGAQVRAALAQSGIDERYVLSAVERSAQSVILYDPEGRRQIHTDPKDIREQRYPEALFREALEGCELAVLCNIDYSRGLIPLAQQAGVPIATDVHAISELDDAYNTDFMAAADILFMSHERLPTPPEEWAEAIIARYQLRILVIGLGAEGALLALPEEGTMTRLPALRDVPIVSTVGAGDALFASFLHGYLRTDDPRAALQRAILFAGHKIGAAGGAEGFLTAEMLEEFWKRPDPKSSKRL